MTPLILTTINPDPKSAVLELQEEFEAVIERFIDGHPELPCAIVLGVLRTIEHNCVARY
jgi:hypothetical protein